MLSNSKHHSNQHSVHKYLTRCGVVPRTKPSVRVLVDISTKLSMQVHAYHSLHRHNEPVGATSPMQ